MSVNADGSHVLFVRHIGHAAQPRCFRDLRFVEYKENYTSQKNAWMDGENFNEWIVWKYDEVRRKTSGDILLIIHNCGGHESNLSLSGFRIETLSPNTTSKYQPLDLGLIAHYKIRLRSMLLKHIVENAI